MNRPTRLYFLMPAAMLSLITASFASASDLSPSSWPPAERLRREKFEGQGWWSPDAAQSFDSTLGMVTATVSPVAVYAGIQALKAGGTAADAAATVALTQVTVELGSVVSYAGIFTMLYYDARAHRVYALNAGYNSYLHETEPATIPRSDLGILFQPGGADRGQGGLGRQTLVPGFMAGLEAMQHRFGRLAFRDLFAPAIWYAGHGVRVSPALQALFAFRAKELARTPEGQRFMRQGGSDLPKAGDLFVQTDLAATLKAFSEQGSRYMYAGQWGADFVRTIQRAGGKVTAEDLNAYQPTWGEPRSERVFGHTVYTNAAPHLGAYPLFVGLNLAEALKVDQMGAYWTNPSAFQALTRIGLIAERAPALGRESAVFLSQRGIDISPERQLGKAYAQVVAPLLGQLFTPASDPGPKHSNAIAVVDREGNIAVVTHTINAIAWGDSGIVVDGIPIPDSAGFQQLALAHVKPGARLPDPIIDTIVFKDDRPVLATASIGSSLGLESLRTILGVLGQHESLATLMAAPPLLTMNDAVAFNRPLAEAPISIPGGAYPADWVAKVKKLGLKLTEKTRTEVSTLRGTVAAIAIDPATGKRSAADQPGVMVFTATE